MKSLNQITNDNRPTSRDYGAMCDWFVFDRGDFIGNYIV